ncbi:MAG: hypothetical protein AAFN93_19100 [Bacteroidota bacterium]
MRKYLLVVFIGIVASPAVAQKSELDQYNPNSIDPIARYEHTFKRRVWRTVDLNEISFKSTVLQTRLLNVCS